MFGREPVQVDVPHQQGEWMSLVPLSWLTLKKARKAMEAENRDVMKDLGAEFMAAMRDPDGEKRAREIIKRQQYDENNFDTELVLEHGIKDWSYTNGTGEKVDVSRETIADLDERTAMWAKQAIIDMTRPPSEDEEKNSPGGSTDT